MGNTKVYSSIVQAVINGKLDEPFTREDFRSACPDFGEGTYNAFLWKHRLGNPGGYSELFVKVAPNLFTVIRPFKYGLGDPRLQSTRR